MSINILDDEVLKRNQQLISNIEENKTLIKPEDENNKTEFAVLYDGDPRKAIEDAKRNVEIDITSAKNRTPSNTSSDPRTDEIAFDKFKQGEDGRWNKLTSPTEETRKTDLSEIENRESLNNAAKASFTDTDEITFDKFEQGEGGRWNKLETATRESPLEGTRKTDLSEIENRDKLTNSKELISEFEARKLSGAGFYLKLQDSEGNLIDPENAKDEEEYTEVLIKRQDLQRIQTNDPRNDTLTYNKVYNNDFWNRNDWFGNRAKFPENPIKEVTVTPSDLEIRDKKESSLFGLPINANRLRELSIFAFMLFPYIGTDLALSVRSSIENPDIVGLATSTATNIFFALHNRKYFTAFELVKYFGHNFYTLYFFKRHSIKYPSAKFFDRVRQWNGEPDILFGEELEAISFIKRLRNKLKKRPETNSSDGSQALTKFKDGPTQSQNNEIGSTIPLSPEVFISGGRARTILVDEPTALLTEGVKIAQKDKEGTGGINPRTGNLFGVISFVPIVLSRNGRWELDPSSQRGIFSRNILESKPQFQELNDLYINNDVFEISNYKHAVTESNKWQAIPDTISEEETETFEKNNVLNRNNATDSEEYFINPDVFEISNYKHVATESNKWKAIPDTISEEETETFEKNDVLNRNYETNEKEYIINDDVINIRLSPFQYLENPLSDNESETVIQAIERRNKERDNINNLQIGSILVAPVVDDEYRNQLPRFYIPFQFNPSIQEAGKEAEYESTKILSRIGELFSFSSVSSLTVTLETEYIATTDTFFNEVAKDGNNWMNFYTLEKIQAIEKAYRSLVLPHYPDTNIEQGYIYVKPPLLRVIMGGSNESPEDTGPYANILTYGQNSMTVDIADSSGILFGSNNTRLKNFIATSVNISKDLHENPIVLDKKGRILDSMRFKVSLNLTEVSANYLDSLPDFKRYSDEYVRRMPTVGKTGEVPL